MNDNIALKSKWALPLGIILIGLLIFWAMMRLLFVERSYKDLVYELESKSFGNRWVSAFELSKALGVTEDEVRRRQGLKKTIFPLEERHQIDEKGRGCHSVDTAEIETVEVACFDKIFGKARHAASADHTVSLTGCDYMLCLTEVAENQIAITRWCDRVVFP